eukprot:Pgem_evm1s12962
MQEKVLPILRKKITFTIEAYALEYEKNVLDCDVPQAFSHWSHEYTKHNLLICDLQGVFDKEVEQPVYQMTDP